MKIPQFVLSLLPMNTAVNLNMFVTKLIEAIMLRMLMHKVPTNTIMPRSLQFME